MAQFRHFLRVLLVLRGRAITSECTVPSLIKLLGKQTPGGSLDITCIVMPIIYDDYVEMLCRLILSEVWIANAPPAPAPAPAPITKSGSAAASSRASSSAGGGSSAPPSAGGNTVTVSTAVDVEDPADIDKIVNILASRLSQWLETF